MIRVGLALLAGIALALAAVAASGDPGVLTAEWLGWRLDTSAAAGALLIGVLALIAVGFWRLVVWIGEAPARAARVRAEARRREAAAALGRGFLALAVGDGAEARRLGRRAAEMADEAPLLTELLNAQAAEAVGDADAARLAYDAMLSLTDAQAAARRGLARLARDDGDRESALEQARIAEGVGRGAGWAWRMLFEDRLEAADWDGALGLLAAARAKKALTPAEIDRARSGVLTARSASAGAAAPGAVKDALKATALSPDFPPAAVAAAALQAQAGRTGRAEVLLLRAWKARPHPAIALAYRDLRTAESRAERAERFDRLITRHPDHRESRILAVERALLVEDSTAIQTAAAALTDEARTSRLLSLLARAAWATGQVAQARTLAAQASDGAEEPGWSEIDPQGQAFDYGSRDWARVIEAWTERHELIHPRHERREQVLVEGRLEPVRHKEVSAFEAQADEPHVFRAPDDPGDPAEWLQDEPPAPPPPAPQPRPRAAKRPRRTPPAR